jgi:hypothetical protein
VVATLAAVSAADDAAADRVSTAELAALFTSFTAVVATLDAVSAADDAADSTFETMPPTSTPKAL